MRVPPPLPYLPSDYQPRPDSPRRNVLIRNRLPSSGQLLTIEPNRESNSNDHFELIPYRDWTVISQNSAKGQVVLYNRDSQSVIVRRSSPDITLGNQTSKSTISNGSSALPVSDEEEKCPYCHRTIPRNDNEPDYMDQNYFRLLASSTNVSADNSPVQSRSSTFSPEPPRINPPINLNENAFNQGYYSKFFVELKRLGKGFRGSVFLCEHVLDGVKLGKYAVKKVAIGNNHPWLVQMLREVHLLERLRHANIVTYKHSWLEYYQLTPFGPEVPCLFILMECANGGNLEEYFEPLITPIPASSKQGRKETKRERIKRQLRQQEMFEHENEASVEKRLLTLTEIWSLFLDIVQGLAHLHQQNIVHRDLKPPNLLLQYDQRDRNGHHGIPRVLISDFGECEDLEGELSVNNRTGATGTLEFMAPEHVRLDPRGRHMVDYSPKADMWSLGMVLYYLCYSRLPYSNIDDIDILRQEILSFKEVVFPKSRLDIYKDKENNPLYLDAMNNPEIDSDIPNELKLLIRLLLSVDPAKRPSCNEILIKIRERTNVFSWNVPESPSTDGADPNGIIVEDHEDLKRSGTSQENDTSRKRHKKNDQDVTMASVDEDLDLPVGLLLNPPNAEPQRWMLMDKQYVKILKTAAAVLKIASCTYSCSPYSTRPVVLYPVIFLATLDFWHESNSPSLVLFILHVIWIILVTIFTTHGLCQA
ncbi:kinase-like domain-containing protein [Rhizopus microsporus]